MTRSKKRARRGAAAKHPVNERNSADRILAVVRSIPRGRVSTYGQVAALAGLPRRARLVGTVLRQTTQRAPWQRVVNAGGRISFPQGGEAYARQAALLDAEGVVLSGGRISLQRYGWPARDQPLDELLWGPH